jgi:hypothetical protein
MKSLKLKNKINIYKTLNLQRTFILPCFCLMRVKMREEKSLAKQIDDICFFDDSSFCKVALFQHHACNIKGKEYK